MNENVIFKYRLASNSGSGIQLVSMPDDATILSVHEQHSCLCLWAQCDPKREKRKRRIRVCLTDVSFKNHHPNSRFIGTVLLDDGIYVVHVFDLGWEE